MSVTVTFEKKHFLMMGLIIAIPFLFMAISNIIAAAPTTGQYHSASELYVDGDIDMNNNTLINSGNISITGSGGGIVFPDGSVQTSAGNINYAIFGTSWYNDALGTDIFYANDVQKSSINPGILKKIKIYGVPNSTLKISYDASRSAPCCGGSTSWSCSGYSEPYKFTHYVTRNGVIVGVKHGSNDMWDIDQNNNIEIISGWSDGDELGVYVTGCETTNTDYFIENLRILGTVTGGMSSLA